MNTTNATTTTTKRMLGSLSSAEQYDDFKWKSTAKLITEGLWQPIAEGQKPPLSNVRDEQRTTALRAERQTLIDAQKADRDGRIQAAIAARMEAKRAAAEQAESGSGARVPEEAPTAEELREHEQMVDAELLPPVEDVIRAETQAEYEKRTADWYKMNTRLWGALVEACDGEALQVAKRAPNGDGLALWKELEERYESDSMASQLSWIMQLLMLKFTTGAVQTHITKFRQLVLRLAGKGNNFPPAMLAVIFLKSLSSQFQQFVTYQMQKQTLDIHQLYKDALATPHAQTPPPHKHPPLMLADIVIGQYGTTPAYCRRAFDQANSSSVSA